VGNNPVGPIFTQKDFDRLASLGANYVNISHPGLLTESAPFQVDLDIQANLDRLLGMVAQADKIVYAVHHYTPFDQYTHQPAGGRNSYPGKFDLDFDGHPDIFNKVWLNNLFSRVDSFAGKEKVIAINEFGVMRWEPGADLYLHDIMDLFEQRGWNHALWAWYPASYPSGYLEGEFDFRLGSDPGNRKVQSTNTLIRTIQKNWAKNRIRPSGFQAPKFK
jgi:hypothetical protein